MSTHDDERASLGPDDAWADAALALDQAEARSPQPAPPLDAFLSHSLDTREGQDAGEWEERFEAQINTFFDEAIARVPGFVDRHLRSFRRVMARSVSPKTGVGDVVIGMRNVLAGALKTLGGPDVSTTTYTHDKLTEAFEREVVSPAELESLLARLFAEFEEEQLGRLAAAYLSQDELQGAEHDRESLVALVREHLIRRMEREIGHDPLLAQAIRSGIKIGIPATLGYVLFGKLVYGSALGVETASSLYKEQLGFYHKLLHRLGKFEIPSWLGAVGWAGGVIGSLAVGGVVEYALNSVRDIKGAYIRQLNTARYILLYGENPDEPSGQGLLHVVRGLERQFVLVHDLKALVPAELLPSPQPPTPEPDAEAALAIDAEPEPEPTSEPEVEPDEAPSA